jgi:hypothetical protein
MLDRGNAPELTAFRRALNFRRKSGSSGPTNRTKRTNGQRPDLAIYHDAARCAEFQRRDALVSHLLGIQADLHIYRQVQPPRFPVPELPPSLEYGQA